MAYPAQHIVARFVACLPALAPLAGLCQSTPPPQGLYQVDQEFTMHASAAPNNAVEFIKKTDGSSGDYTVTRRATVDGASAVERHAGNGPVRACIRPSQPPAWLNVQNCETRKSATAPGGHEVAVECMKGRLGEQWQRLDDRIWQHRYSVPLSQTGVAQIPPAAAAALAPAIAQLEERVRNGPPEHAELARKQLDALRGGGGNGGAVAATVVERWTFVADTCPKAL